MNLADFDPDIVAAYHITEHDLRNVVRCELAVLAESGQEYRLD